MKSDPVLPLGWGVEPASVVERACHFLAIKKHVLLIEMMYYEHLRKNIYEKNSTLILCCVFAGNKMKA